MAEDRERGAEGAGRPAVGEMSEAELDRNLEETFPASDPPSWTLGTDHRGATPRRRDDPAGRPDDDAETAGGG